MTIDELIQQLSSGISHRLQGPITISEPLQRDTVVEGDCTIAGPHVEILNGYRLVVTGTLCLSKIDG